MVEATNANKFTISFFVGILEPQKSVDDFVRLFLHLSSDQVLSYCHPNLRTSKP